MAQCTAKCKSTQQQCRCRAVKGYKVCHVHGAGSPKQGRPGGYKKKDLINQSSGRYAALLPERMLTRYNQSMTDPERLALADEISLVDARIADLLTRVDTGETGGQWVNAKKAYDDLRYHSMPGGDKDKRSMAFVALGECITTGLGDYAAWVEIGEQIEQRRKLVESERKRLVQMQALVSIQEAVAYIQAFMDIAKANVDLQTMTKMQEEFLRLAEKTGDKVFE